MSAPQLLLQAALQRLGVRLGSGLVDAAASVSLLAQDAPEKLRQEFQLFWEEVEAEAQRLERGDPAPGGSGMGSMHTYTANFSSTDGFAPTQVNPDPQAQIDALRAQVAEMARRLEQAS